MGHLRTAEVNDKHGSHFLQAAKPVQPIVRHAGCRRPAARRYAFTSVTASHGPRKDKHETFGQVMQSHLSVHMEKAVLQAVGVLSAALVATGVFCIVAITSSQCA